MAAEPAAIADARRHDPKVIVEAAIIGREVECGVLEFPDGRVEASEIGDMAVFLASAMASHVTGQAMAVDGNTEKLY